jgi:Leucine-rich repeat (LRR) protein
MPSSIVYDADDWRKGMILAFHGQRNVPHLPINVDNLAFQTCTIDELSFKGLKHDCLERLLITGCRIRRITDIPPSLKYLAIMGTSLEELPEFPPNLQTLALQHIRNLETEVLPCLPPTLRILKLHDVNIRIPDDRFHKGITILQCSKIYNPLPTVLPPALQEFDCSHNHVCELPSLPASLLTLNCEGNKLESLPPLPTNLASLCCANNQLRDLPTLPQRLRVLDCAMNQLRILPPLPANLRTLNFSKNPIAIYPHVEKYVYVKISRDGPYFKALNQSKCVLNGIRVFPPSIDDVNFIHDDTYATMMFTENSYDEHDILDCVLEVQRQMESRACLQTIKEELMAVTWHPHRVEDWCGVDFSNPESD